MSIDRKELAALHNPVLTEINEDSPLTVGNGELAFTADVTGMQTLYDEYKTVPLCTMSQWGWHTEPVNDQRYAYTLQDLVMTEYDFNGRTVQYPKKKKPGNEGVYDWLRKNPHRLNLARIALICDGRAVTSSMIGEIHQELHLYEGILESHFTVHGEACAVQTACDNRGRDALAFRVSGKAVESGRLEIKIDFPYGSSEISGSDWESGRRHRTERAAGLEWKESEKTPHILQQQALALKRTLDRDVYYVSIQTTGTIEEKLERHCVTVRPTGDTLEITVSMGDKLPDRPISVKEVMEDSAEGWKDFWEKGGIIRLNRSRDKRAAELERRIILSQYLMAVNSSGSAPPQETGLTCNSWYGKMHLEMYLWHCAWLPLWNHTDLLERSLAWYANHLEEARENARRNGYRGARWPKMIAAEGIDCPSPVAPLLVWQQPHIIYMLEMAYREKQDPRFLETYWPLIAETAEFMADYVVWNPETGCYDICAPVIPAQECHKETDTLNPAFEIEYWRFTLRIALNWARRLEKMDDISYQKWSEVADHMACLTEQDGVYLAHEKCPATFTAFNRDHPSMVGAYGLIDSTRIDREVMRRTLHLVVECWNYPTLWGWDFAMMAMTAVRLGEPELAVDIILKDTLKNCYLPSGNNMQISRKDLPLYLPGNGSLLLAAAIMTAGYEGCERETPGFPDNGDWVVEFEGIKPFL